ncbi:MAG: nucleoside triphosphate pyrophosphohydrolase [Clostridia bacterium]|nr:nucleoside triphosphate pyrophosphohydrolase [Clostridia bacterium]
MKTLTIAPLSTPKTITAEALLAIKEAKLLFVQTRLHPAAQPALESGVDFFAMDELYESASDFDALNEAIADRLTSGGDAVYAVMGDGCFSQLDAIERRCLERGFKLRVLSGVSYAKAAFPKMQSGLICSALETPERMDTSVPLYIQELDDALTCGEVKLKLLEYYPDEHPVELARLNKDGEYIVETLPLYELDRRSGLDFASVLRVPPLDFSKKERFSYYDLVDVMARLRARDGCPWDREQTHESLKRGLLEECYELLEAIDEGNDEHMAEELGDVLMLLTLHCTIAAEQLRFTERDVSSGIVKKMIYRHPHIFSNAVAHTSAEVLKNWDALKASEKRYEGKAAELRSVPKSFPALIRAAKVQKRAAKAGFDWKDAEEAFFKLPEEVGELREAMETGKGVEDELGDVFFALINIARLMGLDSEDLVHSSCEKFIRRYELMERLAASDGLKIEELPLIRQDEYWNRAKNAEKQP